MYDEAKVRERWGVEPGQIADVLALMGDAIDNITGVRGRRREDRGEAHQPVRLGRAPLREPDARRPASCGRRWPPAASTRSSRASWPLLTAQVPVAVDLEAFRRVEPDWAKLRALWMEMEFTRLVKELPAARGRRSAPEPSRRARATPRRSPSSSARVPAGAPLALDWAGERASAGAAHRRARRCSIRTPGAVVIERRRGARVARRRAR